MLSLLNYLKGDAMKIPDLSRTENKKRTALYLDQSFYEEIEAFAEKNGVSVNKASLYCLALGLAEATKKKK